MMEFVIVSNPKLVQMCTQFVKSTVPVGDVGFYYIFFLFLFYLLKNFNILLSRTLGV